MRTLKVFDLGNYDPTWKRFSREAVRAVILRGDKIALVKSLREGYYKFPGGGIEAGETHADTLIRETREETGLRILPSSISEFGMTHELRKSLFDDRMIFEQKSYYYTAAVDGVVGEQLLDGYEVEEGYVLEWVDIRTAYEVDNSFHHRDTDFLVREAWVLKQLLT